MSPSVYAVANHFPSISSSFYTVNVVSTYDPIRNRNIALLIAHPDDEAMFFSPTLLALTDPALGNKVHIVCFSTGDAQGLGEIRQDELLVSASILGVSDVEDNVYIHDHPHLPDSMIQEWDEYLVASLTSNSLHEFEQTLGKPIDTIITFDNKGVSNHPNHISVLQGAKWFAKHYPRKHHLLLYTLNTVPIYRKYLGVLDAFITAAFTKKPATSPAEIAYMGTGAPKSTMFMNGWKSYRSAQKAMTEGHKSQMIWFRWGWITLSRYMFFNDLALVTSLD